MDARRRLLAVTLAVMLSSVTSLPVHAEYTDDTWLENVIGPELLALGDEFGCQGLEDISPEENIETVGACSQYVASRINASRWGHNLISFGTPEGELSENLTQALVKEGFRIVGDMSESDDPRLTVITRNGGSIESGLSDRSLIEDSEPGKLVSLYWIARIDDLNIRRDRDMVDWLSQQPYWFTTWGEWVTHAESSSRITVNPVNDSTEISNPSGLGWSTPGTVKITGLVDRPNMEWSDGGYAPLDLEENRLRGGYRYSNGTLIITIPQGESVILAGVREDDIRVEPTLFNDLEKGVTIAGHHATNMREWSQDFRDTPLRFTWLIERSEIPERTLFLPLLALSVLIATPLAIRWVLVKDKEDTSYGRASDLDAVRNHLPDNS
ncbi:MAG: hypothetical protein ACJZ56_04670 [Candidatus Thalassarchaeaceae archaeon]